MEQRNRRRAELEVVSHNGLGLRVVDDHVAVEEPLEISVGTSTIQPTPLSITMRTPDNDSELALGFLKTEGIIQSLDQVIDHGRPDRACSVDSQNRYQIILKDDSYPDLKKLHRHFYTTSSCGICGKASLEAVRVTASVDSLVPTYTVTAEALKTLPELLRARQDVFQSTGGLHAAALVEPRGDYFLVMEDVGRHNAVDKLAGALLTSANSIDPSNCLLVLSGRTSFELVQKAVMCGIPGIASIGAPSSLAVDLARRYKMLLVGFLSTDRCNVYSGKDIVVSKETVTEISSG